MLPITLQPSIVRKALAAGKHVLSEKPVAPDVAGGRKLIKEYESEYKPKGLIWRIAENYEIEAGYQAAATVIRDGKIGKVTSFNARVVNHVPKDSKWYKTPWRTVPDVSSIDSEINSQTAAYPHWFSCVQYQGGFLVSRPTFLETFFPENKTRANPSFVWQLDGGVVSCRSSCFPDNSSLKHRPLTSFQRSSTLTSAHHRRTSSDAS